jgi:hypothetical protein
VHDSFVSHRFSSDRFCRPFLTARTAFFKTDGVVCGVSLLNDRRRPAEGGPNGMARRHSLGVLEDYAERILDLIAEYLDRTLDELVVAMRKRRIPGSRSALCRFLDRHDITVKKACGRRSNIARMWLARGGAGYGSKSFSPVSMRVMRCSRITRSCFRRDRNIRLS